MIIFKRRLLFWLIRAYLKKWGKVIVFSFLAGLVIFFILFYTSSILIRLIPTQKNETIGIVGFYTTDSLPSFITNKIADGLTTVDSKGNIKPDLAKSWVISDKGHTYTFKLDSNRTFSDGHHLTSTDVNYNFSGVSVERPNSYTISFHLKEIYSPFLVTVSRPIFRNSYVGTGKFRISNVQLNGNFLETITLVDNSNRFNTEKYIFYSNPDVLKTAFLLGEINKMTMLPDTQYENYNFANFPNDTVTRNIQYYKLVTLFYNTQDSVLSDNQFRDALGYAIQDNFSQGKRAYLPYPPGVWYYNTTLIPKTQDITHAKLLIEASGQKVSTLDIKTLSQYYTTAQEVAADFAKLGIKTKIEQVDSIPSKFQIYLGEISLPKDPDQYTLWHEKQPDNISLLIDKRIDEYLEQGRQTIDQSKRQTIYNNFQKYLSDREPATFLYFPYSYTVTRK